MNKLFFFNALRKITTTSFSPDVKTLISTPKPHFLIDYLVNSCGLSPEKAARASKHLPKLKFPSNPDSILSFLRRFGFDDAQITKFLSKDPRFLYTTVEKTLKPRLSIFTESGFTRSEICDLVSHCPCSLWCYDLKRKLAFWQSLMDNEMFIKACRRDNYLLSTSITDRIMPNIALLRERGVPDSTISETVVRIPRLVTREPKSFESMVEWIEELGFKGDMPMFSHALHLAACNSREAFEAKKELLKSLGWPELDVMSAVRRHPKMINLTQENLRSKMEFFVKEVGFEISALIGSPVLLDFSLERRLRPRHRVLKILNGGEPPVAKGTYFTLSERSFLAKYVVPHKEKIPGLYEAYVADSAGGNQGTIGKEEDKQFGLIKKAKAPKSKKVQSQIKQTVIS